MKKLTDLAEPTDARHNTADDALVTSHPTEVLLPSRPRPDSRDSDQRRSA